MKNYSRTSQASTSTTRKPGSKGLSQATAESKTASTRNGGLDERRTRGAGLRVVQSKRRRTEASGSGVYKGSLTFPVMCAIMVVWGLLVLGLVSLQAVAGSTGEASSKNGKNNQTPTSSTTEVENLLKDRFFDENGLSRAENREVITLAAEVVKIIEERGFRVEEVIVPKGYLREFDLIMEGEISGERADSLDPADEPPKALQAIRLRCSTTRLASATAADAIHVYDLWLDGEFIASQYIDIRTPRRAFYQ